MQAIVRPICVIGPLTRDNLGETGRYRVLKIQQWLSNPWVTAIAVSRLL